MIWVIVNIHFDAGLLEKFLKYYRQHGVQRFGILSHDVKIPPAADLIIENHAEAYLGGPKDNELLHIFRQKHLTSADWYIPADLDEFYWSPGLRNFQDLKGDYDFIPAKFVDRLSASGQLNPLTMASLDNQCPLGSSITRKLCLGCEDKVAMLKGHITTNSGHHFAAGKSAPFTIQMHHFKWFSNVFWSWAKKKCAVNTPYLAAENNAIMDHYHRHGRINIFDQTFQVFDAPQIGI